MPVYVGMRSVLGLGELACFKLSRMMAIVRVGIGVFSSRHDIGCCWFGWFGLAWLGKFDSKYNTAPLFPSVAFSSVN